MITPEQCRGARGFLDWSQDRLAEAAGISRQTVVDFERGERNPRRASLIAMQNALERQGIEFIIADDEDPAVKLSQSIWHLSPINPDSPIWEGSIHKKDLIIRAHSERRARAIATSKFGIAVRRSRAKCATILNPWNRLVGEVTCERLVDSEYSDKGPEAILYPKKRR